MGQLNRRALLACLQRLGNASRAQLANESKLSQPTVGKIADDLIRQGIVEEITPSTEVRGDSAVQPEARLKAGRPGRAMRLNRTRPRFLGIHLDIQETRFSLMPVHPQPQDEWQFTTPTPRNRDAWLKVLKDAEAQLNTNDLLGVILCVPGIVDDDTGKVVFSPNLHWTEHASLPTLLHEVWELPVVLVQELRALALGHRTFDASGEDFMAVDMGEGVGAAAVVNGRLYTTQLPMSAELGHTPVHGNERVCGCGATGCLETLISRSGLLQSFSEASGLPDVDLEQLKQHLASEPAPAWLSETLDVAGTIIAGALNVLGMRKVVVTGVFNELPEGVHKHLARTISKGALWERFGEIECVFAPRHHTAGMIAVGIDRIVMPADPAIPFAHVPGLNQQASG